MSLITESRASPESLDGHKILALLHRQAPLEHQLGHADDRVERGADFVAHVGQEGALGAAGGLGGLPGLLQLGVGPGEVRGALLRRAISSSSWALRKASSAMPAAAPTRCRARRSPRRRPPLPAGPAPRGPGPSLWAASRPRRRTPGRRGRCAPRPRRRPGSRRRAGNPPRRQRASSAITTPGLSGHSWKHSGTSPAAGARGTAARPRPRRPRRRSPPRRRRCGGRPRPADSPGPRPCTGTRLPAAGRDVFRGQSVGSRCGPPATRRSNGPAAPATCRRCSNCHMPCMKSVNCRTSDSS